MKIKSVRMYQAVKLAGSLGVVVSISNQDPKTNHINLELVPGLGVKVNHIVKLSDNRNVEETLIIPFANIGAIVIENEEKKPVKVK